MIYKINHSNTFYVTNLNGVGFNITGKKDGIGLVYIRNRSESCNGSAVIVSAPGKGCTLMINIPLQTTALLSHVNI